MGKRKYNKICITCNKKYKGKIKSKYCSGKCYLIKLIRRKSSKSHLLFVWSNAVKQRDNNECQICKSKKKIQAHHLEGYAENKELRYKINNGITLCKKHHKKFHSKKMYGKKNITKIKFELFKTLEQIKRNDFILYI